MTNFKKLKNGQWFDVERQIFVDRMPGMDYISDKWMKTKTGIIKVLEYQQAKQLDNGSRVIIPAYCGSLEKKGKTIYVNFIDFQYIQNGKRPIQNVWTDFIFNFQKDQAYMLKCVRDNDYPAGIKIENYLQIKK